MDILMLSPWGDVRRCHISTLFAPALTLGRLADGSVQFDVRRARFHNKINRSSRRSSTIPPAACFRTAALTAYDTASLGGILRSYLPSNNKQGLIQLKHIIFILALSAMLSAPTTYAQETTAGGNLGQQANWSALQNQLSATNGTVSVLRTDVESMKQCAAQDKIWKPGVGCVLASAPIPPAQPAPNCSMVSEGLSCVNSYVHKGKTYCRGYGCPAGTIPSNYTMTQAVASTGDSWMTDGSPASVNANACYRISCQ